MRIAMVQDDWWPEVGGGPKHVKSLSIQLAEQFEHEVDIYTRALAENGEHYDENETYADGAVKVYRVGPPVDYWSPIGRGSFLFLPVPVLVQHDYDIIHGHTFLPALPTKLTGMVTDTPIVFTVHGTTLTTGVGRETSISAGVKQYIERQFILNFNYDHVISVNNEHLDLLEANHDSVSVVPNGVELAKFEKKIPRQDEILFLGRLAPKKRVSDLIAAFAEISEDFPKYELVIVGTGPKEESLKADVRSRGLSDRVSFKGKVSDKKIPEFYNRASLFVLPSVWEGHPLTLLEAWASGLPVVATNVDGIAEFVEHEENGYLVPVQSPPHLAEGLRYALANPEKAKSWGQAGHELVRNQYSWKKAAEKTQAVYKSIH